MWPFCDCRKNEGKLRELELKVNPILKQLGKLESDLDWKFMSICPHRTITRVYQNEESLPQGCEDYYKCVSCNAHAEKKKFKGSVIV